MMTSYYRDEAVVTFTTQSGEYTAIAFWGHQNLLAIFATTNLMTPSDINHMDSFHKLLQSVSWN